MNTPSLGAFQHHDTLSSPESTPTSQSSNTSTIESNGITGRLPSELLTEILQYLLPYDIAQCALTCKAMAAICRDDYLWRKLLIRRFGNDAVSDSEYVSCREEYVKASSLRILSTALDIVWLNGQYWRLDDFPELSNGKAARLHRVCWLHVTGILRAVPRGHYKVRWHLAFDLDSYGLDDIRFVATAQPVDPDPIVRDNPEVSCKLGTTTLEDLCGEDWTDYEIPSILDVGMQPPHDCEFFDVLMEIVDHSGNWKSGLILDFVELIRVRGDDQSDQGVGPSSTVTTMGASSIVTVFKDWLSGR